MFYNKVLIYENEKDFSSFINPVAYTYSGLVVRTVTYKFGKVPKNADDKELVNTAPSEQSVRRLSEEYESRQSVMKCMKRLISSLSMNL